VDYIVDGRLHHPHYSHCDDHGPVELLSGYTTIGLTNSHSLLNVDTHVLLI